VIRELLEEASSGRSIFISDLHERFGALSEDECDLLVCVDDLLADGGGDSRRFDIVIPRLDRLDAAERSFVESYVHAEIYNILSALGGRRMTFYYDKTRADLGELVTGLTDVFSLNRSRLARSGYGRSVNVIDRMMAALLPSEERFRFHSADLAEAPRPEGVKSPATDAVDFFKSRTLGLEGIALLGVDVGGTDIKAVLVDDGRVVDYKEYDWFPANFVRSHQLIDPICLIARLFRARLWVHRLSDDDTRKAELLAIAASGLAKTAGLPEMEEAISRLEAAGLDRAASLDGIGLCFPDVVVRDKIVGGEVYKTRGIRNNPDIDYEADFAELTDLDLRLRDFVRSGGAVRIINDGPMASFTAAVEIAASEKAADVAKGVFAHTLGTELGTGWITEEGTIPDIPLEVYNFIIDLGSWPERAFEPDDVRSLNNFNTGLPGTLQKYCSQSGIFRLALKYFPQERPDLFKELQEKNFIERRTVGKAEGWYVPTEPVDQRKPFLEHMMSLPDREGDETNRKIWREIGASLGATGLETRRILAPATNDRFLFGRLVKNPRCFDLMLEGARGVDPNAAFVIAGSGMANTPLMKELERHPDLTVAQFAQAIGAAYFANAR